MTEIKDHRLVSLCEHMRADIEEAIASQKDEIKAAIVKLSRSDDESDKLVFSCAMSGKLDLNKNMIETAFSFTVKTTVKEKHSIEDPNQAAFGFN